MQFKSIRCGVIGNPIKHSLSPKIHHQFAKQCAIQLDYQKYLLEKDHISTFVKDFFSNGGIGLNVTLPFKQLVLETVDQLSESAKICQSVNTLSIDQIGKIHGDTTDGAGLILDLERLGYLFKNKNILIIGAGGASISVIYALLKNQSNITLHNRTPGKVAQVISQFRDVGDIQSFELNKNNQFDGVICAVSQFNQQLLNPIISCLNTGSFIYDLNYAERAQQTLGYFSKLGFNRSSDGYGMLIGQAAKSFEIWHGVLPELGL